ncbi:MAG: hypothetical protein ACRDRF_18690, partial [Pseudonocardiaceae bacterium]
LGARQVRRERTRRRSSSEPALAEREPDWAQARAVLDEMIEEAGGIPEEDRRWAGSVLGLGEGDPT